MLTARLSDVLGQAGTEQHPIQSRWQHAAVPAWRPVPPTVACEVAYTTLDGGRWLRQPARFLIEHHACHLDVVVQRQPLPKEVKLGGITVRGCRSEETERLLGPVHRGDGPHPGEIQLLLGHSSTAAARRYTGSAAKRQGARLMPRCSPI